LTSLSVLYRLLGRPFSIYIEQKKAITTVTVTEIEKIDKMETETETGKFFKN